MFKVKSANLIVVAGVLVLSAVAVPVANAAVCVPATNIQAIIDDSASMSWTDRSNNRSEALKILMSKTANAGKTLGAVEFGTAYGATPAATTVFLPQRIGTAAAAMRTSLNLNVKSDHEGTDYNAGFAQAKIDNPTADARIFLTDGAHNFNAYQNGHAGGPPTYVVGLDKDLKPADMARLQAIATETGGRYFSGVTAATVNSTMNEIDAALNCQTIGKTFNDVFLQAKKPKAKSAKISSTSRSIDLVLSWEDPKDSFTISAVRLQRRGRTPRLKIKRTAGATFLTVHVSNLSRGTLRFKLTAKRLESFGAVTLTTQATQSRTR